MTTQKEMKRIKIALSGGDTIEIRFSNHSQAKEFYDYHRNFMLFLNKPIKTIELL